MFRIVFYQKFMCFKKFERFFTLTQPSYHDLMSQIKILRRKTGVGISLCLEALKHCNNNHEEAIKYIISKSSNCNDNMGNETREMCDVLPGLVGITVNAQNNFAVMSKISCQTDFTAKTDEFIKTFSEIMEMASRDIHKNYEFRPLEKVSFEYNDLKTTRHIIKDFNVQLDTIEKKLNMLETQVSEKLTINNFFAITIPENHYLGYYCHWNSPNTIGSAPFLFSFGRIGALVVVCKDDTITPISEEFIRARAREVAIHVVGMLPSTLELDDTTPTEQSISSSSSEISTSTDSADSDIADIDKYVGGALLDQPFFFRKSLKTRFWAFKNKIKIVDYLLME